MSNVEQYQDANGVVVDAVYITGPTILNTINGEEVGEVGQVLISPPNSKPSLLDAAAFQNSFTPI